MEERGQKFFKPECHSESFLTGNIPPHVNKEEKDRNTQLPLQNVDLEKILLDRDRTFDL